MENKNVSNTSEGFERKTSIPKLESISSIVIVSQSNGSTRQFELELGQVYRVMRNKLTPTYSECRAYGEYYGVLESISCDSDGLYVVLKDAIHLGCLSRCPEAFSGYGIFDIIKITNPEVYHRDVMKLKVKYEQVDGGKNVL